LTASRVFKNSKKILVPLTFLFSIIMYKAIIFLALVCAALAQNIRQGSAGADVVGVQYLLRHHGHNIAADGQFGPGTHNAVVAFQRGRGLAADGIVGANTVAALGPVLRSGATGDAVRAVQYLLRTKFGAGISVDGQFGAGTDGAVKNFQRSRGLDADGIVGRNTWSRLFSGGAASPPPPSGGGGASCGNLGASTRYTAYSNGQNIGTVEVVQLQGKRVEKRTACAFLTMANAARGAGLNIQINSGFRTMEEQQYFWNCYQTKKCNNGNLAARPGYSNHQNGIALDLNVGGGVYGWLSSNAHKFGFIRTVPSENWHWEYRPGQPRASFT
jgi:peptidoglycan hydrolase-like protein with peptidoglycan-binding domain